MEQNKRFLSTNGISMSEASHISNLCNQSILEIDKSLNRVNNASKHLTVNGEHHTETKGVSLPENISDILLKSGKYRATQAFLSEMIKLKTKMLDEAKSEKYDSSKLEAPTEPNFEGFKPEPLVDESWGWTQLSNDELSDYWSNEAHASSIGQFIHKGCKLDKLRDELTSLPHLEWFSVKKDEKIPVTLKHHHTSEQLLAIHNTLANLHRQYESKVNFYKAKVKNLVNDKNSEITNSNNQKYNEVSERNTLLRKQYDTAYNEYTVELRKLQNDFESDRLKKVKEISALKISVPAMFQDVVSEFLVKQK